MSATEQPKMPHVRPPLPDFAYIARYRACGCPFMVCVDDPNDPDQTSEWVAHAIADGGIIERVPRAQAKLDKMVSCARVHDGEPLKTNRADRKHLFLARYTIELPVLAESREKVERIVGDALKHTEIHDCQAYVSNDPYIRPVRALTDLPQSWHDESPCIAYEPEEDDADMTCAQIIASLPPQGDPNQLALPFRADERKLAKPEPCHPPVPTDFGKSD